MPHGNRLTDMEFDEISLVTRPANQLSKVVLYKSGDMDMPEAEDEVFDLDDTLDKGGYKKDDDDESETDRIVDEDEAILRLKESKKKVKKDEEVESMLNYIEALESANESLMAKLDEADEESVEEYDHILKGADPEIVELFKAAEERAAVAEEIAKAERENRLQREFIEKAATYDSLPVETATFGIVLKDASESMDADTYDALTTVLAAANEAISQGGLMSEIGVTKSFDAGSGMGRIEQAASVLQAENTDLTREAAIAKAVTDDPSLYDIYNEERR